VQDERTNHEFGTEASSRDRHHLLVACFPKSGSSFLVSILANLTGFRRVSLVPDFGRREAELSLHRLIAADRSFDRYVAKHHLRYSQQTRRLIDSFSLQTIVLVRDIHDVVASIRDQIKREAIVMAQAYVPPDAPRWGNQRLEEFISDMIIPWYFNFYASWAESPNRVEMTYEELRADPHSAARRIRDLLRIKATDAQVSAAVNTAQSDPVSSRFNVGLCGRGKQLAPGAISRIRTVASYYAFLDLSSIGLPEKT
jgi:hypothetical protein